MGQAQVILHLAVEAFRLAVEVQRLLRLAKAGKKVGPAPKRMGQAQVILHLAVEAFRLAVQVQRLLRLANAGKKVGLAQKRVGQAKIILALLVKQGQLLQNICAAGRVMHKIICQ